MSVISYHCLETGHEFDWDHTHIRESWISYNRRLICETVHIKEKGIISVQTDRMTSNFSQMYIFPFLIDYLLLNFLFPPFLVSSPQHSHSTFPVFPDFSDFSSFPLHSFQHILTDAATRDVNFKYDTILVLILFFDHFQSTYKFLISFFYRPSLNVLFIYLFIVHSLVPLLNW